MDERGNTCLALYVHKEYTCRVYLHFYSNFILLKLVLVLDILQSQMELMCDLDMTVNGVNIFTLYFTEQQVFTPPIPSG